MRRNYTLLILIVLGSLVTLSFVPPFPQVSVGRDETCVRDSDGTIACVGDNPYFSLVPPGTYSQVRAGWLHGCALADDRTVTCWGYNADGRASAPTGHYLMVTVGHLHSCALTEDYHVVCWGDNSRGQSQVPVELESERFIQVVAGGLFTCALRMDGHVVCWGDNTQGQVSPPVDEVFEWISAGAEHACGLREPGEVVCWGRSMAALDERFQNQVPQTAPVDTANQSSVRFVEVSCGEQSTCALTDTGRVICWGDNSYGQLDALDEIFVEVSVGWHRACGVTHNRRVICWGDG